MNQSYAGQLENRGVIGVSGADRRTFLQGLISNDINLCSTERAIYAALLTPQGKFLHDLFIIEAGEEFLIDCEAARIDDLLKRLAAYKLRAKISLRNANADFDVWAFSSDPSRRKPGSSESLGQNRPNNPLDPGFRRGGLYFADPRLAELGFRAIVKKENSQTSHSEARTPYDRHRLSLGVADGSRDMLVEKSTLAEGNFDLLNGISFSKGCYVGQELTARMHYRALVKKRLFPVKISGASPAFGAAVTLNGEEIGDMRSSNGDLGLALLSVEKAEAAAREKTALICDESKLTVSKPGWMVSR